MKIYIAGMVSNNPYYKEEFKAKEEELKLCGHTVINPIITEGLDYQDYIDIGLTKLSKCDAIYMLKGWELSKGARLEHQYAETNGMKILYELPESRNEGIVIG